MPREPQGALSRRSRRSRRPGAAAILAKLLVVLVMVTAWGCTSPTLPLPPPVTPTISAGTEPETFKLTGSGDIPNALIIVVNRNEAVPRNKRVSGTLADEHGSWDVVVFAHVGDVLDLSQESGENRSPDTTVTVH